METPKNYGLKIDEIKPEDYIFGASPVPFEELVPDGDWTPYLPKTEAQNLQGIEPYACVTFSLLNSIEMLIRKQYGEERNYSDRFLASVSGTKEGGNSPQIVCEFLRKVGVVQEDLWPFSSDIDTFQKYYAPLPPKLYELAGEFNKEWDFKHEFVPSDNNEIQKAIKCSPLPTSVAAWHKRDNKYFQPQGVPDNHLTTMIKVQSGEYKRMFDSYDSFIKDYEWNTTHAVIKRIWLKKKLQNEEENPIRCFVKKWWDEIIK